jgi:hypothetical protein
MAEENQNKQRSRVTAGGAGYGPDEGESAADAFPANTMPSRDAKDYVLVTKYVQEADGLRIEEQVPKAALEDEDSDYHGLSTDDEGVVESHPAANRPTSDLSEEEAEELDRDRGQG